MFGQIIFKAIRMFSFSEELEEKCVFDLGENVSKEFQKDSQSQVKESGSKINKDMYALLLYFLSCYYSIFPRFLDKRNYSIIAACIRLGWPQIYNHILDHSDIDSCKKNLPTKCPILWKQYQEAKKGVNEQGTKENSADNVQITEANQSTEEIVEPNLVYADHLMLVRFIDTHTDRVSWKRIRGGLGTKLKRRFKQLYKLLFNEEYPQEKQRNGKKVKAKSGEETDKTSNKNQTDEEMEVDHDVGNETPNLSSDFQSAAVKEVDTENSISQDSSPYSSRVQINPATKIIFQHRSSEKDHTLFCAQANQLLRGRYICSQSRLFYAFCIDPTFCDVVIEHRDLKIRISTEPLLSQIQRPYWEPFSEPSMIFCLTGSHQHLQNLLAFLSYAPRILHLLEALILFIPPTEKEKEKALITP
jgi:hypothetical protein